MNENEWTVRHDNMIYSDEIFVTLIPDKENRDRVVAMHNATVFKVIADDAEIIVELEAELDAERGKSAICEFNTTEKEWTQVKLLEMYLADDSFKSIAEAHNAALAAERGCLDAVNDLARNGKESDRFHSPAYNAVQQLREQLAAEREVGHNTAVSLAQQITKLEDQLAAAKVDK